MEVKDRKAESIRPSLTYVLSWRRHIPLVRSYSSLNSPPMKIVLCSLMLMYTTVMSGQTKLRFEKLDEMPHGIFAFGHAQSEDEMYAIGGSTVDGMYTLDMNIYNANAELWITVPVKDLPRTKHASAIYLDDYKGILLAGGTKYYGASTALVDEIRIVYPDGFKVDVLGLLPEPAKGLGLAKEGNKVYFFGGSTSRRRSNQGQNYFTFSDQMYVYNLEDGHMAKLPDMPVAMETQGGIVEGKLYTFGGFKGTGSRDIWQYTIETATWKALEPLKETISGYALAQYEHYFIMVGDFTDGGQLILYDTRTQTAEYFKTNLSGRDMGASVMGDELHVYGGLFTFPVVYAKPEHYKIAIQEIIKFAKNQ